MKIESTCICPCHRQVAGTEEEVSVAYEAQKNGCFQCKENHKENKWEEIEKITKSLITEVTDYGYNDEYGYYNDWADGVRPIIERHIKKVEQSAYDKAIGVGEGMKIDIKICGAEEQHEGAICNNCESGLSECTNASKDKSYNQAVQEYISEINKLKNK